MDITRFGGDRARQNRIAIVVRGRDKGVNDALDISESLNDRLVMQLPDGHDSRLLEKSNGGR